MTNLILMYLFLIVTLAIFGFAIYKAVKVIKSPMANLINYPLELKKTAFLVLAISVATTLLFVFICMNNAYPLKKEEWAEVIFGSLIFGASISGAVLAFIYHYYGKEINPKLNKWLFIYMIASFILSGIGLILLTNGFADYLIYPLVNGISFKNGTITYVSKTEGDFAIAFYAILILLGALLTYFVSDHRFYKEYGKHGILESTLYIAFPAGIIGARVGYVIGEWNTKFASRVANGEWWSIFAVWEGGLTIISGALIGVIVGVAWFLYKNKKYNAWLAVDVIIPAILLAQTVGRWGNFFNGEVHGLEVLESNWSILPKIIANNMHFSSMSAGTVTVSHSGYIFLPLFLIEGVCNLCAYFLIRFGVGVGLKKHIEMGDLACLYFISYGLIRVLLEPLRHSSFKMGEEGYWSWFWSFFYILLGVIALAINHLYRYFLKKKEGTYIVLKNTKISSLIVTICLSAVGLILLIVGSTLMLTNEYVPVLDYNPFNNGLLLLILGLSSLVLLSTSIPPLKESVARHGK